MLGSKTGWGNDLSRIPKIKLNPSSDVNGSRFIIFIDDRGFFVPVLAYDKKAAENVQVKIVRRYAFITYKINTAYDVVPYDAHADDLDSLYADFVENYLNNVNLSSLVFDLPEKARQNRTSNIEVINVLIGIAGLLVAMFV